MASAVGSRLLTLKANGISHPASCAAPPSPVPVASDLLAVFLPPDRAAGKLRTAVLIGRNLDEAAVRIAAIDRAQSAAGALLGDRAFLDRNAMRREMRDHLVGCAGGEKTE